MRTAITRAEMSIVERRITEKLDFYLDSGFGACHLQKPEIAKLVVENFKYFHPARYHLCTWCVMPNHVHVIVYLEDGSQLGPILESWKSYTGLMANRLLGRRGQFWGPDYFDRVIRDDQDLADTTDYVLNNPRKAGLIDWPWVGVME